MHSQKKKDYVFKHTSYMHFPKISYILSKKKFPKFHAFINMLCKKTEKNKVNHLHAAYV